MRGRWSMALLVLLVGLLACGGAKKSKDGGAPVGKVTAVSGEVTYTGGGQAAATAVTVGLVVTRDMTFTTGAGASLEVKFDNNYVWKLAEKRERKVAALRVIDLPRADSEQTVGDELAGDEQDRTTGAGRHAEQSAGESASELQRPQIEAAPAPSADPAPGATAVPVESMPPLPDAEEKEKAGAPKSRPKPQPSGASPKADKRGGGGDDLDVLLDGSGGASGGASGGGSLESAKPKGGPPLPPPPGPPTRELWKQYMLAVKRSVDAKCKAAEADGVVKITIKVDGAGKITSVTVSSTTAGDDAAACVRDAALATPFPSYSGAGGSASMPFQVAK